jgi:N-acetylglucosamine-6-sulfatase
MTRRQFHLSLAGAALAQAPRRPNLLFLLTDDQRWDQMGCAGHPFLRTPNMDRLAREGARFANAFVTTALCSPSRAAFLTGRYNHANGVRDNRTDIPEVSQRRTFPYLLRESGYETAYFGKFHMGNSPQPHLGFDHWAALPGQGRYLDPVFNINGETRTLRGHSGQVTADMAIEWLRRSRTKPFCMVVGFKEPHGPRTPPAQLASLYSDVKVEVPNPDPKDLEGKPASIRNRKPVPDPERYVEDRRNYWRCITAADEQIGRILAALEEQRLVEQTVVVFAGDNGYFLGEFGLGDKRYAYDVSLRIPLLIRYPGVVRPGTVLPQTVLNIDLCPTLLDLCGLPVPKDVHGRSWRPLFADAGSRFRQAFLYEYFVESPTPVPTIQGWRTSRWKYIHYPDSGDADELYDLEKDPQERRCLSGEKGLMAKLRGEMERELERTT